MYNITIIQVDRNNIIYYATHYENTISYRVIRMARHKKYWKQHGKSIFPERNFSIALCAREDTSIPVVFISCNIEVIAVVLRTRSFYIYCVFV